MTSFITPLKKLKFNLYQGSYHVVIPFVNLALHPF